jgi:NitT/TauT family transport system substrate-binding protein
MSPRQTLDRRQILVGGLAAALAARVPPAFAEAARFGIKVASNQGAENASLQQLMLDQGYLQALSLDAGIVESRTISGPMEALLAGEADVCMISAFVGVLPAIEQGKDLRLIGAAMLLPALAVFTSRPDVQRLADLDGRSLGVGPKGGLLHTLAIALLRKAAIDPAKVNFVFGGSNAQVFEAVAAGKVDAGLSGPAGLAAPDKARVVDGGKLWEALPEYTYQPAFASLRALREKPEAVARCLAAYTRLYRYLSSPASRTAYLEARRKAAGADSVAEGQAVWDFVQKVRPYALQPGLTPERVAYLQQLNVAVGLQTRVLPFDQVADLAPAKAAARILR